MLTPGTTSHNDPARYQGPPVEALRKPAELRPEASAFCLLPLGQQLAASCRLLALLIVRPYKDQYPRLADDLDSVAGLALVRAAALFDPNAGFQFTTYAGSCVSRAALDLIQRRGPKGYRRHADKAPATVSIVRDDGSIHDMPDRSPRGPAEEAEHRDLTEVIGTVMARMEPRLADILRRRAIEGETLEEIGRSYDLTKERIRQLELRAVMKIHDSGVAG